MRLRFGLLCAVLLISTSVFAQDFRGGVSGTVKDGSGEVLPGVTITVTNVETNVAATAITDVKGFFQIRYLNSGTYNVEAKLEGFKPVLRKDVTVRIGDTVPIDFKLELGGMTEIITVTAKQAVLDTTSGVTGQVIDNTQIQRLPLGDGTAYMLTRLAPGLADSSDLHFSRPMDNGNLAGITTNGARTHSTRNRGTLPAPRSISLSEAEPTPSKERPATTTAATSGRRRRC